MANKLDKSSHQKYALVSTRAMILSMTANAANPRKTARTVTALSSLSGVSPQRCDVMLMLPIRVH